MKNSKNSKVKLIPLGDRVLLRPIEEEVEKNFGKVKFVLAESAKEKSDRGKVVAVGEGKIDNGKRVPLTVKVGDTVIFSKYGYDEVKLGEEELYLVKEDNILAIIK